MLGAAGVVSAPLLSTAKGPVLVQDTSLYPFLWFIPLSIGVAILRSGLCDIGGVINRTLVYGVLCRPLLALIYIGLVLGLRGCSACSPVPRPPLVHHHLHLAIVAAFQPLRRRVQAFIDRRFSRREYNAQQVLASSARKWT